MGNRENQSFRLGIYQLHNILHFKSLSTPLSVSTIVQKERAKCAKMIKTAIGESVMIHIEISGTEDISDIYRRISIVQWHRHTTCPSQPCRVSIRWAASGEVSCQSVNTTASPQQMASFFHSCPPCASLTWSCAYACCVTRSTRMCESPPASTNVRVCAMCCHVSDSRQTSPPFLTSGRHVRVPSAHFTPCGVCTHRFQCSRFVFVTRC